MEGVCSGWWHNTQAGINESLTKIDDVLEGGSCIGEEGGGFIVKAGNFTTVQLAGWYGASSEGRFLFIQTLNL